MIIIDNLISKIVTVLLAIIMACFIIFDTISGGRYIYLCLSCIIMLIGTKGNIRIKFSPWYLFNIMMILYTGMSVLWSWDSNLTAELAIRQLVTFLCFIMIYIGYSSANNSILPFYYAMKWAAWIVTAYIIIQYGPTKLIQMVTTSTRMGTQLGNSNLLGMSIGYGILADLSVSHINKQTKVSSLLIIPEMIVILASQSRKALLIPIIGYILCAFFYSTDAKHPFYSIVKILLSLVFLYVIIYFLSQLSISSGILRRMSYLFNFVTGEGEVGLSVQDRSKMIEISLLQFKETPLFGTGIGTAIYIYVRNTALLHTYICTIIMQNYQHVVEYQAFASITADISIYSLNTSNIGKQWIKN